jgi:hypothetical protein
MNEHGMILPPGTTIRLHHYHYEPGEVAWCSADGFFSPAYRVVVVRRVKSHQGKWMVRAVVDQGLWSSTREVSVYAYQLQPLNVVDRLAELGR